MQRKINFLNYLHSIVSSTNFFQKYNSNPKYAVLFVPCNHTLRYKNANNSIVLTSENVGLFPETI